MIEPKAVNPHMVKLRRSHWLAAWIGVAAVGASLLGFAYLRLEVAVAVCALTIWRGWYALAHHALRSHPAAIVAVALEAGYITVLTKSGRRLEGRVRPGGLVSRLLTVVTWEPQKAARASKFVVLFYDSLDRDDFRRLRVQLRWARERAEIQL